MLIYQICIMEPFNFNELPEVVRLLFEKVELIEQMVRELKPAESDEDDILDVAEAAVYLKTTVAAIYTKVSRKEIPYSKPGKKLYFNRAELQEWIASGKNQKNPGCPSRYQPPHNLSSGLKPHKLDSY